MTLPIVCYNVALEQNYDVTLIAAKGGKRLLLAHRKIPRCGDRLSDYVCHLPKGHSGEHEGNRTYLNYLQ